MGKEEKLIAALKSHDIGLATKILQKNVKSNGRTAGVKQKGINLDYQESNGLAAIHHAAAQGNSELLVALLTGGARPDLADSRGMRALHYASGAGHASSVETLLVWGGGVHATSREGLTPLHLACANGHVDVVELLLHYQANPNLKTLDGKTPLDLACSQGKYNVVNLLLGKAVQMTECTAELYRDSGLPPHTLIPPQPGKMDSLDRHNHRIVNPQQSTPTHQHHRLVSSDQASGFDWPANEPINAGNRMGPYPTTPSHQYHSSHGNSHQRKHSVGHYESPEYHPELGSTGYDSKGSGRSGHHQLPTLNSVPSLDANHELRQNLKEACFAVQAKAIRNYSDPNNRASISFQEGDLITVLRDHPGGMWKGFVTAEGVARTGIFPGSHVSLLSRPNRRPCALVSTSGQGSGPPSNPPTTPLHRPHVTSEVANQTRQAPVDDLDDSASGSSESCSEDEDVEEDGGSPVVVPPGMTVKFQWPPSSSGGVCQQRPAPVGGYGLTTAADRNSLASVDSGRASSCCGPPRYTTAPLSPSDSGASSSGCYSQHSHQQLIPQSCNCNCQQQQSLPMVTMTQQHATCVGDQSYPSMLSLDGGQSSLSTSSDSGGLSVEVELMLHWLHSIGMPGYGESLVLAGYDLGTLTRATPEDLNASGVTNPNDRKNLKAELSKLSVPDGLPDYVPDSVFRWLKLLKLDEYYDIFDSQGYRTMQQIMQLTWEDLCDIGIDKLGHQKKLSLAIGRLNRLRPGQSWERHQQPVENHISPPPPPSSSMTSSDLCPPGKLGYEKEDVGCQSDVPPQRYPPIGIVEPMTAQLKLDDDTGPCSSPCSSLQRRGGNTPQTPTPSRAHPPPPPPKRTSSIQQQQQLQHKDHGCSCKNERHHLIGSCEPTTGDVMHRSTNGMPQQHLPFANENVGTIRPRDCCSGGQCQGVNEYQ